MTSTPPTPVADSMPVLGDETSVLGAWCAIGVPCLLLGLSATVGGAFLFGDARPAILVWAACCVGLMLSAWRLKRQQQQASACIRRPELRNLLNSGMGVFSGIVDETRSLLNQREAELLNLLEARNRLEARAHLLKTQLSRLERALCEAREAVLIVDSKAVVQYRNATADRLFASCAGDLPDVLREHLLHAQQRRAAADHRVDELVLLTADGEQPFRVRLTLLADVDHRAGHAVVWLENICVERAERNRHAEFVASVCHELKTPLAGIRAYTELLQDGEIDDPQNQQETLSYINDQVDRLTRLVNNMLNFARIESGVIKVQREDCDLNSVLKSALETVQPAVQEKRQSLTAELSELYLPVHVDRDLFGQAIINLLSNAVKYTPCQGRISIRSRMDESSAVIEVRDSGVGIPEASLSRLFDRFYRVPENAQVAPGTGLGLALVKYIVTSLHEGSLSVQSQVNQGSTFVVTIPLGHRQTVRRRPLTLAAN